MPVPERPQLRPHLAAAPEDRAGRHFLIWDQLRLSDAQVRVSALEFAWVGLFDGEHTLRDIQAEAMRQAGGQLIPLDVFHRLAELFEETLFLDGPRFREKADAPVRPPACIGS